MKRISKVFLTLGGSFGIISVAALISVTALFVILFGYTGIALLATGISGYISYTNYMSNYPDATRSPDPYPQLITAGTILFVLAIIVFFTFTIVIAISSLGSSLSFVDAVALSDKKVGNVFALVFGILTIFAGLSLVPFILIGIGWMFIGFGLMVALSGLIITIGGIVGLISCRNPN